mgnify:CR=1 FL=1
MLLYRRGTARTSLQLLLWQCLPLSVVQLKGKHCRKTHCHNGVVDTFCRSPFNISPEFHSGQCTPLILSLWSKVQQSQRKYELLRGEEVEPWSIISMGFWPITNRSRESWLLFQVVAPCLHCKDFEYSFYTAYRDQGKGIWKGLFNFVSRLTDL